MGDTGFEPVIRLLTDAVDQSVFAYNGELDTKIWAILDSNQ